VIDTLRNRLLVRDTRVLVRVGIVLGVLSLSAWFGRAATLRLVLLLVAGAAAILLVERPHWGLVALIPASLTVPFAIGTGTQTTVNITLLLVAALLGVWAVDMMRRHRLRLVPSQVNLPALMFVLVATLALAAGQLPWNPFASTASLAAQLGGLSVFVLSAGALLLMGNLITELRWLRVIVGVFLALGALVVLGRLWPSLSTITARLVVFDATRGLFWVWLVALAAGLALFNRSLATGARAALLGLALCTWGVMWFTNRGWATGWLPPGIALLTLLWLRSWRLGLLVTGLGIVGILAADPDLPARLIVVDQYSIDTRLVAWKIVLGQVLPLDPILGLGPANYNHYTPLYPILGWYVQFNSHNQYVDILAQTGLLGMGAFLWLMAAIARLGWSLRDRVGDGFARGYVYASLAGLVGTLAAGMLADWVLPFVYNITLDGYRASVLGWLFSGGLVAIQAITRARGGED
jgi:hypothetical protein